MLTSNRITKTVITKPRLSTIKGASDSFSGKTDFELEQKRRRKDHKPTRKPRAEWYDPNQPTKTFQ